MYYSKQIYSPKRKFKRTLLRTLSIFGIKGTKFLSQFAPKVQDKLGSLYQATGSFAKGNVVGMFKTWFTVLTLLIFSYAMIYADNFQAYDNVVLGAWSGLEDQIIKNNDSMVIDLEDVVVDESDALWIRKITYTARKGDTPSSVASQFGITTKNLKLVNHLDSDILKPGTKLVITPVEGFVIQNTAGNMTVEQFANKHFMDVNDLRELNDYTSNLDIIKNGYDIFIPLTVEEGIRLGFIKEEVVEQTTTVTTTTNPSKPDTKTVVTKTTPKTVVSTAKTTEIAKSVKNVGKAYYSKTETSSTFGFAAGNCTAYVAKKKPEIGKAIRAEGGGHAKTWYAQASKAGLDVGKTPTVGSVGVMGTTYGYYGHVGIVTSVSDKQVCMNNANVRGRGVVSEDCFPRSAFIGYIY